MIVGIIVFVHIDTNRIRPHILASSTRQSVVEHITTHQACHRGRQRRVARAVALALRVGCHCRSPLRNGECPSRRRHLVVRIASQGHRDGVAADSLTLRTAQRVVEHIAACRAAHRRSQRRVGVAVHLVLVIGRHRDRPFRNEQVSQLRHQFVVQVLSGSHRDGVHPHSLAAGAAEGVVDPLARHGIGEGSRQRRVFVAIHFALRGGHHHHEPLGNAERATDSGHFVIGIAPRRHRDRIGAGVLTCRAAHRVVDGRRRHPLSQSPHRGRQRRVGVAVDFRQRVGRHRDGPLGDGELRTHNR